MPTTIDQLKNRKSVRTYTEREIEPDRKADILLAAMAAPTAGNQQLYTILDITDQRIKDTLAESCDHQPFIATAKMVLVFCLDFQKWYDAFVYAGCEPRRPGAGDFMLACQDAAIAAQNAVTAAESLGIGSCYIGDIMEHEELHRELLHLPEFVFPALMLVFGYPTEQQIARPKPRRAQTEFIVHENAYRPLSRVEIMENLVPASAAQPPEAWLRAFCARKYESAFSREMTRSVCEALKHFSY